MEPGKKKDLDALGAQAKKVYGDANHRRLQMGLPIAFPGMRSGRRLTSGCDTGCVHAPDGPKYNDPYDSTMSTGGNGGLCGTYTCEDPMLRSPRV